MAPRDLVVDVRRVDDEAVLGRAPRVASRPNREGTRGCNVALVGIKRLLHQDGWRGIDKDRAPATVEPTGGKLIM